MSTEKIKPELVTVKTSLGIDVPLNKEAYESDKRFIAVGRGLNNSLPPRYVLNAVVEKKLPEIYMGSVINKNSIEKQVIELNNFKDELFNCLAKVHEMTYLRIAGSRVSTAKKQLEGKATLLNTVTESLKGIDSRLLEKLFKEKPELKTVLGL